MRPLVVLSVAAVIAGCGAVSANRLAGNLPGTGTAIPATNLKLSPSVTIPLEKLVFWGTYASAAYLIVDPLAPNWEIEEAKFPEDRYHLSLQMKRVYSGGAGEARALFHRRAGELAAAGDYGGYQVIEYTEGLNSSVLGAQRIASGVIQLTKKD